MSDAKRRMSAYYYRFDPTGIEAIDKVLGAVACAGKAFHLTADWNDECGPYDDHTGATPIEWIQNAAVEAGDEIDRLRTENERLRAALSNIRHKRREMDIGDLSADEAVWEVDAVARAALEGRT